MCQTSQCGGGVGRNIAEALWRLRGGRTHLLTAVGNDAGAEYLLDIAPGLILDGCIMDGARTASYAAVFDKNGECLLGLGDMEVHNRISIELVKRHMDKLEKAPLIVLDGNIPQDTVNYVMELCDKLKKPIFFEPTDKRKATKTLNTNRRVAFASPNITELRAMANYVQPNTLINPVGDIDEIEQLYKIVSKFMKVLLLTMGKKGVVILKEGTENDKKNEVDITHYNPDITANIENVSGAGDCFTSGVIHGILEGLPESQCVLIGFKCAKDALLSKDTVPNTFNI